MAADLAGRGRESGAKGSVGCETVGHGKEDGISAKRVENVWFEAGIFGLFLLIGHQSMNEFLNKRGLSDTGLCVCGRVENVWHIVFECGLYDEERRSCESSGWIREEETRFERLLESKEMYI
ncbi:hypothetical protein Zmor_010594 [Zophobas morio]|uniref:Reverse transcriptase n=1 Tax=Zophobas morio TaxID=2755281 RepID=A0AA38IP25_9CUCU|nr:hypothetical protein Zmor_010594 [Zophobas morio]